MSEKKAKRRLFNIRTDEVSLVDMAANQRKFLLIKNQEGPKVEEILKALQAAINTLIAEVGEVKKRQEALEKTLVLDEAELKKAGAKFSKETMGHLRSMKSAIEALLAGDSSDGSDDEEAKGDKTKKRQEISDIEELGNVLSKSIGEALKEEEKKESDADQLIAGITKAIADAFKQNQ